LFDLAVTTATIKGAEITIITLLPRRCITIPTDRLTDGLIQSNPVVDGRVGLALYSQGHGQRCLLTRETDVARTTRFNRKQPPLPHFHLGPRDIFCHV
jgi:hypothetical protein